MGWWAVFLPECSQVSTHLLLSLNGFEESLEVASAETLMISALNDLKEESGAIFDRLGKDLQQVALLVVVDQNLVLLQSVNVFFHFEASLRDSLTQLIIVGVRDLVEELNTASLHPFDRLDDIFRAHSDMLHTRSAIVVTVLLDL